MAGFDDVFYAGVGIVEEGLAIEGEEKEFVGPELDFEGVFEVQRVLVSEFSTSLNGDCVVFFALGVKWGGLQSLFRSS